MESGAPTADKVRDRIVLVFTLAAYLILIRLQPSLPPKLAMVMIDICAMWFISVCCLFVYLRWNGPPYLRDVADEIRVLPRYRSIVADVLFPKSLFNRIARQFVLSAILCCFLNGVCFIYFVGFISNAYMTLIGIHILRRIDLMTERSAIFHAVICATVSAWGPVYIGYAFWNWWTLMDRVRDLDYGYLWTMLLFYGGLPAIGIIPFLTLAEGTGLFLKARRKLKDLKALDSNTIARALT